MMTAMQTNTLVARSWEWIKHQWARLLFLIALFLFPFVFSWLAGSPIDAGPPKFWQGQLIVIFVMAVYAMSYDLLIGYTGILTFGHAAFFGGGAYAMALFLTHVAPDIVANYRITLPGGANITEGLLLVVGVSLALVVTILLGLLFSAVSARVKGHYFAMITLAMAEALYIFSKATDFVEWTGADEGLHGVPVPAWINPTQFRLRFYFVALIFAILMYLVTRRIVNSPTGRVFIALRENESRVRMIGYNPAVYRALAFVTSAVIAGLAGALYSLWTMSATPTMTGVNTTINALLMTILGGDRHAHRPDVGRSVDGDFRPLFLPVVRRSLAASLWPHFYRAGNVPALWNRRHLASALSPDQAGMAAVGAVVERQRG